MRVMLTCRGASSNAWKESRKLKWVAFETFKNEGRCKIIKLTKRGVRDERV